MSNSEFELYRVPMDLSGEPTKLTIVALDKRGKDVVVFAATETEMGHEALFTLAVECGAIPSEATPMGGAIVDARTGQLVRHSKAFRPINRTMLENVMYRIDNGDYEDCLGEVDTSSDEGEDGEEWLQDGDT